MDRTPLSLVSAEDWTILRAIARRMLRVPSGATPHPADETSDEVDRTAARLSGYVEIGEMEIRLVLDDDRPDGGVEVELGFADGLEPIVFPLADLELRVEPPPQHFLDRTGGHGGTRDGDEGEGGDGQRVSTDNT